jgi:uncharacterized membrane protein
MSSLPTTIPAYLEQLRSALAGADPALVQDALYDAEEYLRSELAENPGKSESEVITSVAGNYGAPEEVADIYRDTEVKVQTALRPPAPAPRRSALGRFFGVVADPRTYGALFYMLLALATGIFYFTWVVTGVSMSAGLAVLIIGIPFVILYFGSVRLLSLVEGRIVEVMLGERMPRRPLYSERGKPWLQRIAAMFTDPRTWSTQLYFLLMMPLGIAYFTIVVTGMATSIALIVLPVSLVLGFNGNLFVDGYQVVEQFNWWEWVAAVVGGVLLLFATLHLARGIGRLHGLFAKHLLVKSAQYA